MPTKCWWNRLSRCGTTPDPTRPRSLLSSMMRSEQNNEGNMETNKEVVLKVLKDAFTERDATVVDRYFSPDYVQHNPVIPNGPRAIGNLIPTLKDLSYEIGMVVRGGRSGDGSRTLCRLGAETSCRRRDFQSEERQS